MGEDGAGLNAVSGRWRKPAGEARRKLVEIAIRVTLAINPKGGLVSEPSCRFYK